MAGQPAVAVRTRAMWWLSCLVAAFLIVPGCGGCGNSSDDPAKDQAKNKKAPEKPKPDFEPLSVQILPQRQDLKIRSVKPGHWTAAIEQSKANNFDFVGELRAEVRNTGLGPPIEIPGTPFRMQIVRPAALPKGQPKSLELSLFVPRDDRKAWLFSELVGRGGSSADVPVTELLTLMKAHQYFLVVLSSEAERYRRLSKLDSVLAPHGGAALEYYQVIAEPLEKPLPVPSNPLLWTSIAYVIWDDVDPEMLSAEQQQALVAWLHLGGQLIVSGPKSLDQLRDKAFLGSYLPALPGEALTLDAQTLEPINRRWTLPVKGQPGRPLSPVNPWSGIVLQPQGDARYVDHTGKLVVERAVGRGRIVATAFRLAERELWNWPSFDGFVNACLLRRPARVFRPSTGIDFGGLTVVWADGFSSLDPERVTQVRLLARDWRPRSGSEERPPPPTNETAEPTRTRNFYTPSNDEDQLGEVDLDGIRWIGPGAAAWNDLSPMADAARTALREAAGIVIPSSSFVIWVLALYLVVLVPLNWLVFWALGRVEWAWFAAPLIALGGMVSLVRMAQLDIGFACSQTEVGVLETFNGYPRGHLTRYTALYTSLSTTYDIRNEDPTALILPFAADTASRLRAAGSETVTFHSLPNVELTGFAVSSNSTGMVHSEQMFDLGGPIDFATRSGVTELYNRSKLSLRQAGVIRRTAKGEYQVGWIGQLGPGRGTKVTFLRPEAEALAPILHDWTFSLADLGAGQRAALSAMELADLVRGVNTLRPGETRLVALVEEPLAGLTVEPRPSQNPRGATLVVAHLEQPPPASPQPDSNTRREIVTPREERDIFVEPTQDDLTAPEL